MAWRVCGKLQRRNCASGRFPMRSGTEIQRAAFAPVWEVKMRLKALIAGTILSGTLACGAGGPALADDTIYIQLPTYRTGPYAGSGIPIANGMADYLTMLNERDGGVNGVKIVFEECETGYDTQKGVECYEQAKAKKSLVFNPYSTGITLA